MLIQEFKSIGDIISNYGGYAEHSASQELIKDDLDGATILLAWYGYGDYCGSSFVLFEKNGKLYEVNGSHCSCYGLEDQWEPEETTWKALSMRTISGSCDGSAEAEAALKALVSQNIDQRTVIEKLRDAFLTMYEFNTYQPPVEKDLPEEKLAFYTALYNAFDEQTPGWRTKLETIQHEYHFKQESK